MLDRGVASLRREVEQWYDQGITPEELAFRKTATAGEFTLTNRWTSGETF